MIDALGNTLAEHGSEIAEALAETGFMVLVSLAAALLVGLPLGTLIYLTRERGVIPHRLTWSIANLYVTIVRSFPFLLFVVFLIPLTRLVFGTTFGTVPATFPLCFVAAALFGRLTEQILLEIPPGIVQTARAMGATTWQIVTRFLLVEARSGLVYALTSVAISLVSYSTVLGVVGGGGIGDFALRYGYQTYDFTLMYLAIALTILCVVAIQFVGQRISTRLDKR